MTVLFLDACAIIYQVEADNSWTARVRDTLATLRTADPELRIAISDLSRLECRIRPLREGQQALLDAYETFFSAEGLIVVALPPAVIDLATTIRARRGLRTPDALQAACCLSLQTPAHFVTNDRVFRREPLLNLVLL